MARVPLLLIDVDNVTMDEALARIEQMIEQPGTHYVVTPNVDHMVKLEADPGFKAIYDQADLILTDGMPLVWISRLLGRPVKEKVSGSDLFPRVCALCARRGWRMFLLGAAEGVAARAAERLAAQHPGLVIAGTYSPPFGFEKDAQELGRIVETVKQARPHVLAVGLGAPKQERFIHAHRQALGCPVLLAVGASIDFAAGTTRRAPRWMQRAGLEWFYRFLQEPRRMFRRYFIDDLKILRMVIKYRR